MGGSWLRYLTPHPELLQPGGWAAFPSAALPYITQSSPFWLCNPFCLFSLLVCWSPGSLLSPPLQRPGSGSCSLWALPDASALPHLSDKPPPPPRSRHVLPSSLLSPIRRTIYTAQSRSSCFPILNRGGGGGVVSGAQKASLISLPTGWGRVQRWPHRLRFYCTPGHSAVLPLTHKS